MYVWYVNFYVVSNVFELLILIVFVDFEFFSVISWTVPVEIFIYIFKYFHAKAG